MKIVHLAPISPYNEGWGYQENLLPKFQRKLGHEVSLIVTDTSHKDGEIVKTPPEDYISPDGIRVIRRARKEYGNFILSNILAYIPVYDLLTEIEPDFIFFHCLQSASIFDAVKYRRSHPDCVIVQDNHLDYNIGFSSDGLRKKILRSIFRFYNRRSIKYVDRVYGVTPWRKQYASEYFGIPEKKTDVLIMGADDDKLDFKNRASIRANIRAQYGIGDDDFLIVSGGKIDKKKKIDILVRACCGMEKVKLLVFGNVSEDLKEEFSRLTSENKNIIYIGWIASDRVYDYYFAADLAFFPGQHSVLWEQACASKLPCVFEKWPGMDHVDNGGNSEFISPVTEETIREEIKSLLFTEKYEKMKAAAQSEKTDIYLYSSIAEKSLECAHRNNE